MPCFLESKLTGLLRPSDNSLSNETVTKLNFILLARLVFLFSFLTIEYIEVKNIYILYVGLRTGEISSLK